MTKKHFIEIAATLKSERDSWIVDHQQTDDPAAYTGPTPLDGTVLRLASTFKSINPNFDRARFLAACGV